MNHPILHRWLKFNGAGLMGVLVQMCVLALFTRGLGCNYLVATAIAVEAAVLHNFVWHERVTWAERGAPSERWKRLRRFNLTTGAVSIAGNLLCMKILVEVGVFYLAANLMAIALCSLVNFAVSELWVFRVRPRRTAETDQLFF